MSPAAKRTSWIAVGLLVVAVGAGTWIVRHRAPQVNAAEAAAAEPSSNVLRVDTVQPAPVGMARMTVQPGSAHSFESADIFAKVSGYLRAQHVDIGSRVKKGALLAEIDVPELNQELEREKALLRQAEAEVVQAEANVRSANAEHKATEALIAQSESNVARSKSETEFRDKQYQRIRELHALNSIEERLVDERLDQLNAARSSEAAARNSVLTAQQQALAAAARIGNAEAELLVAKAKVDVARAVLEKTSVLIGYTKITSPYDGVVTARNYHPGAFIRAADQGGNIALFSVDRIDLMRIVVLVPDRDVPYTHVGDKGTIVLDALPGKKFEAKVARLAAAENPESRTMRVELDLPNSDEVIRDGMYGQVEIELEPAAPGITIPSTCLVGAATSAGAKVFVADGNKVRLTAISVGKDSGAEVEVKSGLSTHDRIVVKPPSSLSDGMTVDAVPLVIPKASGH